MADSHSDDEWFDELTAQMRDSAMCVTLFSGTVDLKLAIEVGLAVLLDMPIIVHDLDANAPRKLLAVADELVIGSLSDSQTSQDMAAAIFRLTERIDDDE